MARQDHGLASGRPVVENPGSPGYEVSVWRVFQDATGKREELVSRDLYAAKSVRVRVGAGPPTADDGQTINE